MACALLWAAIINLLLVSVLHPTQHKIGHFGAAWYGAVINKQVFWYGGMQHSIFGACPKPGLIGSVATERASGIKMGYDGGGSLTSSEGVAPSQTIGVSASVIFPCTTKSRRRWLAKLRLLAIIPWAPHIPMQTGGGETQSERSTTLC